MGDRANFVIRQSDPTVYLCIYGHWAGDGMFDALAHALNRVVAAGRVNDESYANRIMISSLVNDHDSDLGWGVSVNYVPDNEHSVPVVDFQAETVELYSKFYGSIPAAVETTEPKFVMPIDVFIQKYLKVPTSETLTYIPWS